MSSEVDDHQILFKSTSFYYWENFENRLIFHLKISQNCLLHHYFSITLHFLNVFPFFCPLNGDFSFINETKQNEIINPNRVRFFFQNLKIIIMKVLINDCRTVPISELVNSL